MPIKPSQDARQVVRLPGNDLGPLHVVAEGVAFSAEVQDISVLGVGLVGDLQYAAGSSFVIQGDRGWKLQSLTVELRHSTQRADGRWVLGCCFARRLTVDDVELLG